MASAAAANAGRPVGRTVGATLSRPR